MKNYSYSELGMLVGAAIGCAVSILLFLKLRNAVLFTITGAAIILGTILGDILDRKKSKTELNQ